MSIIGNASLNRVVKTLTNFDVYFNISAESTSNLVQYEIFLDDVSQGITSITPIKQTGLITVNTFASNIGYHTFGVLFTNSAGESEYFTQTIYLDHTTPILHEFNLSKITRDSNNNFVLHFNVKLEDETGISKIKLINTLNGEEDTYTLEYSTNTVEGEYSITLPYSYGSTTKRIVLEYEDYSGNKGTSSPQYIYLTNVAPVITNSFIKKVEKNSENYLITIQVEITQDIRQYITDYLFQFDSIWPGWNPIIVSGTNAIFEKVLTIPIDTPAGNKTIRVHIKDNYSNSDSFEIPYYLDKENPEGTLFLNYAEKIGDNYYANVKFSATDSGTILGYGYQLGANTLLNWNYTNTPSQIFETSEIINLGTEGSQVLYGQYVDSSGNLSPIYTLNLEIDTINPDCRFEFLEGYKNDSDDYVAKFHILASDDKNVQFIKLYGYNTEANTFVSSLSNDWIRITETNLLDDIHEVVLPKTETDGNIEFYFQAKDIFGNESALRTANVIFDKNDPIINVFDFHDTIKTTSYYRVFMNAQVTDDRGITAYRKAFNNINYGDWISIEKTQSFNQNISLDIPITDVGITKDFKFQVKDVFGNLSNTATFPFMLDEIGPTGDFSFVGAALNTTDYILDFQLNAEDQGTGNVHFYSITVNDSTTRNWKPLANTSNSISEVVSYELSRTNQGIQTFYLRFADTYKNESPLYSLNYDLDSIAITGGIELSAIVKAPESYYANVHLYAIDNRRVDSYSINGGTFTKIEPPVNEFEDYLLLPIGLSTGLRTFNVQYKDSFGNESDIYSTTFNLDTEPPTANLFANGVSSNTTHYDLNMRLEVQDNQELLKYKFWYTPNGEPSDWTQIPSKNTNYDILNSFTIPRTDVAPTFEWRVLDFFENELYGSDIRPIVTTPPGPVTLSVNNILYSPTKTTATINYSVLAAANTTVDKLNIIVNKTSAYVKLDEYTLDIENKNLAVGTFTYDFAINKTFAIFDVAAVSDYGFVGPTTQITKTFDTVRPYANASFIGAFEDNYDYILQFHIEGSDYESSLSHIQIDINSFPLTKTFRFDIPYTNEVDDIFNIRIDQSHTSNFATAVVRIYDMNRNSSTPITISDIYLDRFRPNISNIVLNDNLKFGGSNTVGINTEQVPIRFDAEDFSYITHYKYSKSANIAFDSTWTSVPSETVQISISETVDISTMNFEQGIQTLFIHAKDKFNNIGTAGVNFELDTIPPELTVKFSDRIERTLINGLEFFKIPYKLNYSDNYSEVVNKYTYTSYLGNTYPQVKSSYGFLQSNDTEEYYYLPFADYDQTQIFIALEDRMKNKSDFESFSVLLETEPPVIHNGLIDNGSTYTTNKDVYVEMDMSDNIGVTEVLFSSANNNLWNDPNWQSIPFAPRQSILSTFTVDLEALGFVEGTCNVQMYVKDFCQNVTRYSNTVIYDKTAPVIEDFYVNNITRNIDTFEIEAIAKLYDVTSGLSEYYISQSNVNKIYNNIPGGPIIGNTSNTIVQTEYISVRDGGMKKLYLRAKDAAGNESLQANTEFYIDNVFPFASYFSSKSSNSKYYLNNTNNVFEYIVNDDFAIYRIDYDIDQSGVIRSINTHNESNLIKYDAQTFLADFSTLSDGEHTIELIVEDFYKNKINVPYKFYLDNTPPTISKFEIKEIKPSFNGLALNYDVEFDFEIEDNSGISKYELYDNGDLITEISVNDNLIVSTPTIVSVINAVSSNTETHTFELKAYDYATNMASRSIVKNIHNGNETIANNFTINGSNTYTTSTVSNVLFEAMLTSDVNINQYALTISPTIEYHSAFWNDFSAPSSTISFNETLSLNNFSVNTLSGATKIYLHVKDDCGNISNNKVDVFFSDNSPTVSNVSSPINLIRQGKYYVGNVQFEIKDPNSLIEAYAVGLTSNPTNFKSIPRTSNSIINHQLKIPESSIDGSKIIYLQLRDEEGNLSNNYRISVRILDFKFSKFEIDMNKHIANSETVRIYFETESDPHSITYGYQLDSDLEPIGWNTINVLNRNDIGEFYFDFNLNVSYLTSGQHTLYVWLKNGQSEKIVKSFEFVSEPLNTAPFSTLSIQKTEYKDDKKYVWVAAMISDVGVGVSQYSLEQSGRPDNFININTIQNKRIVKRFEYNKTNNSTIIYKCKLIDAVGTSSITSTASVDLSNVY